MQRTPPCAPLPTRCARRRPNLLAANARVMSPASPTAKPESYIDRLRLTAGSYHRDGRRTRSDRVAARPRRAGAGRRSTVPNGLNIERVAVPIGVIGMIYESRPNVGADASALVPQVGQCDHPARRVRKPPFDQVRSSIACSARLRAADLPEDAIQTVQTTDRGAVACACCARWDWSISSFRGAGAGWSNWSAIRRRCRRCCIWTATITATFMPRRTWINAVAVIRNAKLRRTGVCGATEKIVDRSGGGRPLSYRCSPTRCPIASCAATPTRWRSIRG